MYNSIMDAIGDSAICTLESTIDVYTALSREYDKMRNICDNTSDTSVFNIVQEGSLTDYATGKNTDDGMIKKIILFVPRLLIGIVKAITGSLSSTTESDCAELNKNIESASPETLESIEQNAPKTTENLISFDAKTKEFKVHGKLATWWNRIVLYRSTKKIITRLREVAKSDNLAYKEFINEIDAIRKKEKDFDEETIALAANVFADGVLDVNTTSKFLASACKEVGPQLEKQLKNAQAKGLDTTKMEEIKMMVDRVGYISSLSAKMSTGLRISNKLLGILPWRRGKGNSGAEKLMTDVYDTFHGDEAKDELQDMKNEERNLKSKTDAVERRTDENNKLQNQLTNQQKKLGDAQNEYNNTKHDLESSETGKEATTKGIRFWRKKNR